MTYIDWKPLETAPKNGAGEMTGPYLLLWCKRSASIHQARWTVAKGVKGFTWAERDGSPLYRLQPTHWAELPEGPPRETALAA